MKEFSEINYLIKETEKKTIWKIDECEKIIMQKVNKEYVESSCKMLEERIY